MALGQILREAREHKGLTTRQVAESTRMLVQIVEELEREDFRRIAAPLYGRGFIKLYCECVGIDSEPLIEEFMDIFTGNRPPQIVRKEVPGKMVEKRGGVLRRSPVAEEVAVAVEPQAAAECLTQQELPAAVEPVEEQAADIEQAKRDIPLIEVVPPEAPAPDPTPDLFSQPLPQSPPVVRPEPVRSEPVRTEPGRTAGRQAAGPQAASEELRKPPQVRPFSGKSDEPLPNYQHDEPVAEAALERKKRSQRMAAPQQRLKIARPQINVTPVIGGSRAVGRGLAKLWQSLPVQVYNDRDKRRWLVIAVMVIVATVLLLLLSRINCTRTEVQTTEREPVRAQRVLPPPQPYVE